MFMAKEDSFYRHGFGMNNKQRTRKNSTKDGATMEGGLWSLFGDKY
jgi:hypothetical protein